MKNTLKILTILTVLFLVPGCEKDPDLNMPVLKKGIIPVIEKDLTTDLVIFDNDISGFAGKVSVELYYPDDKPQSMDLMVSLNDDPDISAVVVANMATYPVNFSFTAASLVDVLPNISNISELTAGDFFRFYCRITLEDGTVVNGNDPLYKAYSSGIANLPGSSTNVVYPIACGYEPAIASGAYESYSAPDQWNASGPITITVDPVDNTTVYVAGLEELEGLVEDGGPLVMHINPMTFEVTADYTVLASNAFGYHNLAYEGSGTFNSCNGTYSMIFELSVDEGSFGALTFTFTRE